MTATASKNDTAAGVAALPGVARRPDRAAGDSAPPATTTTVAPVAPVRRTSLNGSWMLDKSRGESSMTKYLQVMNVDPLAVEAHEKGEKEHETIHTIELSGTSVRIAKRSRVNNDLIVELELGKEHVQYLQPGDRPKKSLARSDHPGHLRIESSLFTVNGKARVSDVKFLDHATDPNRNTVLVQHLTIVNDLAGKSHTQTRYFLPYQPTPPEHLVQTKTRK